jgi:hypothetical protein
VFEPLEPTVGDLVNEGEEVMLSIDTGPTSAGDPIQDTATGWRELLDADALKDAIYRDRLLATIGMAVRRMAALRARVGDAQAALG